MEDKKANGESHDKWEKTKNTASVFTEIFFLLIWVL